VAWHLKHRDSILSWEKYGTEEHCLFVSASSKKYGFIEHVTFIIGCLRNVYTLELSPKL
jgi:hypothetical protein